MASTRGVAHASRLGGAAVAAAALLLGAGLMTEGHAQSRVAMVGKPLIRNYLHREFGGEVQAWDVVQHPSGLVYVANNAGVLEYDGRTWRLISLPSRLDVRALALEEGTDGRIFVGASGDFGYLAPDGVGRLAYRSLLPDSASDDEGFDDVFRPTVTPLGVYFQARHRLCRWAEGQLSCRSDGTWLSRVFAVAGRVYVQTAGGLVELLATGTRPLPGGAAFATDEVTALVPFGLQGGGRLLVGTRDFDLRVQDGDHFVPFAPSLSRTAVPDALLKASRLPDGTLALATERRGVLIVDADGQVRRRIDESVGLQENHVHAVWPDREGGVWLALQHGISRVAIGAPYTLFDEDFGLEREWRDVARIGSMLYVRGYKGLFAADLSARNAGQSTAPRFERLATIEPPVWSFLAVGDRLLVTSRDGIYEVSGKQARRVATLPSMPLVLHASRSESSLVYVGLTEGIGVMRQRSGRWHYEGRLAGIDHTVTSLVEERRGTLWFVSQRQRVLRAEFTPVAAGAQLPAVSLSAPNKSTLLGRVAVRVVAGEVVLLAENGIFTIAEDRFGLVPSPTFQPLVDAGRQSFAWVAENVRGDIWVASRSPGTVDALRRQWHGGYTFDAAASLQIPVRSVYPDPVDPVLWLAGTEHLLQYDLLAPPQDTLQPVTLIRQVTINAGEVVYGRGQAPADGPRPLDGAAPRLEFPHRSNAVHFEFSAPGFSSHDHTQYQSYLEGFDSDWSPWSPQPTRSYTNLPCGTYRFHVRSRDASGAIGAATVFEFDVQRPWYRSWLAYGVYGAVVVGGLITVWTLQLRRARWQFSHDAEKRELDRLRDLDRLKTRIFADIAHEFRTPLTLILGPITQMLDQIADPDMRRRLMLVRRNADSMLRLVSQLLDLATVESGRVRLQATREDLAAVVKNMMLPFAGTAERQDISLCFEALVPPGEPDLLVAHVDKDVLEKVVNNLLANALKFTPNGGEVLVRVRNLRATDPAFDAAGEGCVEIAVHDTGIGIAAAHLPHIFNRFYQAPNARRHDGIGIGLALVKELVELHGGGVDVRSVEGTGTTVVVRLPKGTGHLAPDQIGDEPRPALLSVAGRPIAGGASMHEHSEPLRDHVVRDDSAPTVLVVEDHDEVRAFLCEQLRVHYRVVEASDGDQGMALALERVPDLVLSDVMMERTDGFALCRALKAHEKTGHIPVVLLTARAARTDRLSGLGFGADCYIVKPFDTTELLAQVKNLIEQRRSLRERFRGPIVLKPAEIAVAPMEEVFLTRVLNAIQNHLDDVDFDVEQLGREVGLSRSQLHRKLRALTNQSPTLVIRSVRLQRAAELLRHNGGSVAEITYQVGFSSQAYFAKCFRDRFGCTPKEYAHGNSVGRAS